MTEAHLKQSTIITEIEALLIYYSFELQEDNCQDLLNKWLEKYLAQWIRLAIIEALYLGRYKSVSIEQILTFWLRKGNYTVRFSHEFEALICRNLPKNLPKPETQPTQLSVAENRSKTPIPSSIDQFRPNLDSSKFFLKLKAVSQSSLES